MRSAGALHKQRERELGHGRPGEEGAEVDARQRGGEAGSRVGDGRAGDGEREHARVEVDGIGCGRGDGEVRDADLAEGELGF